MIELLGITEVNGRRKEVDYNNRKKEFIDKVELERYRKYLEGRLGQRLFFTYREKA